MDDQPSGVHQRRRLTDEIDKLGGGAASEFHHGGCVGADDEAHLIAAAVVGSLRAGHAAFIVAAANALAGIRNPAAVGEVIAAARQVARCVWFGQASSTDADTLLAALAALDKEDG